MRSETIRMTVPELARVGRLGLLRCGLGVDMEKHSQRKVIGEENSEGMNLVSLRHPLLQRTRRITLDARTAARAAEALGLGVRSITGSSKRERSFPDIRVRLRVHKGRLLSVFNEERPKVGVRVCVIDGLLPLEGVRRLRPAARTGGLLRTAVRRANLRRLWRKDVFEGQPR